ncbi:MAG TPA: GNAT family N-acetyltransferase [Bradyrhizobium sp.]|uniref:GNAT family N-acetyltransferase n=1 Tax=Bradyrhizobium sp. TaxID=376 RepID=UPI002D808589|nr:GNAT family N-acetyltransferase [Bradyrhizobium sp.]HET7889715.1 GNAT family N-acetyltransferase [Bradyrhizobium sp.]
MADLNFRRATEKDVPAIVRMLADDTLGASRETTGPESLPQYLNAFRAIDADPNQFLLVVEDGAEIVGTLQLTFIAGLSRGGLKRGLVEAVRVASSRRGEKIGEAMIAWAIEKCRREQCGIIQLTTDKSRTEAHRFYDRLGFEPSHIGYKMMLR